MARPVHAITFDLWDTLIADDSDEQKRAADGREDKPTARRTLLYEAVRAQGHHISHHAVNMAYDGADAAARYIWQQLYYNISVADRIGIALQGLGAKLPESALQQVVQEIEEMELAYPPDLVPGCREMLQTLSRDYKLAVVSDAIVSPGRCLRKLLAHHHIEQFFQACIFSDEAGHSKPHAAPFAQALQALQVEAPFAVHIGDRQHNDIAGAQRQGMRAVLFYGANERCRQQHTADAEIADLSHLPEIITALQHAIAPKALTGG